MRNQKFHACGASRGVRIRDLNVSVPDPYYGSPRTAERSLPDYWPVAIYMSIYIYTYMLYKVIYVRHKILHIYIHTHIYIYPFGATSPLTYCCHDVTRKFASLPFFNVRVPMSQKSGTISETLESPATVSLQLTFGAPLRVLYPDSFCVNTYHANTTVVEAIE